MASGQPSPPPDLPIEVILKRGEGGTHRVPKNINIKKCAKKHLVSHMYNFFKSDRYKSPLVLKIYI